MTLRYTCSSCNQIHEGIPGFSAAAPFSYYEVPEQDRDVRCSLGTDDCVLDGEHFFIRGCIEVPVAGHEEPFIWGVWVSLSRENFEEWLGAFEQTHRAHLGPYFGWLNAWLSPYPNTMNLKTMVHPPDHEQRPWIELEPTSHPLAVEQRDGISEARARELCELLLHPES